MLSSLSGITQTIFPDGGYFSEVVGKNKELYQALDVPMPDFETDIKHEADTDADKEDEGLSGIDDLIKLSEKYNRKLRYWF